MKDIYKLASDREDGEPTYGAVLTTNPPALVLGPNKLRVLDALARVGQRAEFRFDDPSIKAALGKYGQKSALQPAQSPPTLWMCIGGHARVFGFWNPKDSGVLSLIGAIALGDGMEFNVSIEAGNRQESLQAWQRLATFARLLSIRTPSDKRLDRISSLFVQANPGKMPGAKLATPFVGHWSYYVRPEQMADWFAPFFEADSNKN
jgi:hypothetical protein